MSWRREITKKKEGGEIGFGVKNVTSSSVNSCFRKATRSEGLDFTIVPAVGSTSPASTRTMVVLPHPLAPTSPTRSPVRTCTTQ